MNQSATLPPTIISLPSEGFVRLPEIIGDRKRGVPARIPESRTSFLNKVRKGVYPQPVHLGVRMVAWRVEDIRELIGRLGAGL